MAKKYKFVDYFKFFILSVFVAFVVTLIAGLFMGYKYILVNGWSAQQKIPYQSFILTYKCSKTDLYVNDFATTSINGKGGYITHQVIGIKYDGYFENGECYSWEMNGQTYHAYYGYQVGDQHNITAKPGGIPSTEVQAEEISNMSKYEGIDFIKSLLPIVDNFERAIEMDKSVNEKFLEGYKMIYANLISILNTAGVKEIECQDKEFDPNLMDAIMTEHVDKVKPNYVLLVLQKGYTYKDKVIRHAFVKVSE